MPQNPPGCWGPTRGKKPAKGANVQMTYRKQFFIALTGALVAIPTIAGGFYFAYQVVTFLGN